MSDMENKFFFVNMDMLSYVCYSNLPPSKKIFASFSENESHVGNR